MSLLEYISPNESIMLRFGISPTYYGGQLGVIWFFFGGAAFYFSSQPLFVSTVFSLTLLIIAVLLTFFVSVQFFFTIYFVTETKIYKKTGFIWKKVIGAKQDEISDVTVVQGISERFLFNMGTLKINTSGSAKIEVILPYVFDPFGKKQLIYVAWGE
jgi:uncharacterized membrane protein YdbT with pleckstrin-like domain